MHIRITGVVAFRVIKRALLAGTQTRILQQGPHQTNGGGEKE